MKRRKSNKVLIIDDSEEIRTSLKMFLEAQGCQVKTANSGEEGLSLARINDFKVVLIDICMPGIGGEHVLMQMKKIFPKIPIIMVTGLKDEAMAKNCMELGAYDFIRKPFDFDYLQTSVLSTLFLQ